MTSTGPFTLSPGDTQEVIYAVVGGLGADNLSSISVMKHNVRAAHQMQRLLFATASPPAAPKVTVVPVDGKILLEWGNDTSAVRATENKIVAGNYRFEGYNVYQLPAANSALSQGKKVATYDVVNDLENIIDEAFDYEQGLFGLKVVQSGTNSGIRRHMLIANDYLADWPQGTRLKNGTEYYYAVTAYSYSPDQGAVPRSLESAPRILSVKPQVPFGVVTTSRYGDTLKVTHTAGPSDGVVLPLVVDPTAGTGDTYEVRFDTSGGVTTWALRDATKGTQLLARQSFTSSANPSVTVDGVEFIVENSPVGFKRFEVAASGTGPLASADMGAFAFNNSGFPTLNGLPPDGTNDRPQVPNLSSGPGPASLVNGGKWGIHTGMNSVHMSSSYDYFINRVTQSEGRWPYIVPYDFEIRFTAAGGVGWNAFTDEKKVTVPFELWNIGINTPDDRSDDYRLFPYILDVDGNDQFNLLSQAGVDSVNGGTGDNATGLHPGVADHTISDGTDDPFTDWFYMVQPRDRTPGESGYNAIAAEVNAGTHVYLGSSTAGTDVIRRLVLVNWDGGSVSDPSWPANVNQLMPATGTVFRILSIKPHTAGDVFAFTIPAVRKGEDVEKLSAEKVGVYPNPFFGWRSQELSGRQAYVTFNNLPPKVKIRIFNLAGQLVKTLEKDNSSQFLDWDLTNENNWLVASGIYLCYVEMPEIGVTKVLKLAVVVPAGGE